MIVDTHVHIWEMSEKYPIGPNRPQLDLRAERTRHRGRANRGHGPKRR